MIDLHMHSTFSDGSLTPEELVAEAGRRGLTAVALTDHDTLNGLPRFLEAGRVMRVRAISGVEISADSPSGTMHMLGYFIRSDDATLNERLEWMRGGREARNETILERLKALDLPLTWDEVRARAGEDVVGRPHIAAAMEARGYVKNKTEAFDRYLGRGKPAYVERRRLTPAECIALIRGAGGVAVLAHPFTLELKPRALRDLVAELARDGLGGLEVYYSEHKENMVRAYLKLAEDFGLAATGGSDFHGAVNPAIHMGAGFGKLRVPDDLLAPLEARKPAS